jgi:ABC-type transport system involved in multi-copper enzyme maturation permease subunit
MNSFVPRAPGFVKATVESARQTLRLQCRARSWLLLVAHMAASALLAWVLVGRTLDDDARSLFCVLAWWLHGTVVVPWVTLYLGVQTVHGDLEDRTFQYLFLRPVGRAPLLVGKWICTCAVAVVFGLAGLCAMFAGAAAHADRWVDGVDWSALATFAKVFALAAFAYAAAAVFFAARFGRPLLWAAAFVVGLQTLTANLPVSAGLRSLTIVDPLRRLVLDGIEPGRQLAEALWPAEFDYRREPVGEPVQDLAWLIGVCLVLALWSYCRTEYDSRPRE